MSTGQGRARIEFEADASGVSAELIAKMTATMDRIAAILEKGFSQGAAKAESSLDGVGAAAEQAGRKTEQAGASAKKMGSDTAAGADRGKAATDGMSSAMGAVATTAAKAADASTKMGTAAVSASRAAESAELKLSATRTKATRDVVAAEAALKTARSSGDTEKIAAAESRLGEVRARATASVIDAENRLEAARSKASASATAASQKAAAEAAKASTQTTQAATSAASAINKTASAAGAAAGKMSQVGSSGRAGFDGASSAAQGLIGKIGGITIALGAVMGPMAMLKGGFDRLMNIQRAEIGFKNIGLTAAETEAQMAKLTEQVTGTSVSLSDAAKYSAMFAQSGVEIGTPMDDSIKAFTSLAAAAQGTGTDVGVVMQQISAAGRLMGGDAMQLQQAGINIYKYVADYMGKSMDEVKKLGEEGKISFEDVVGAINTGMGDYAKEMGETLPAKISNLKTSVSSLGAALIEPFIGPITAAVEFGTAVFKYVRKPLSQLQGWLASGSTSAEVFKVALAAIGSAVVVGAIVGLVGKVGLLTKVIGIARTAWGILNLAFLFSPIGLVVAAIGGLVAGFVILWNRSEAFRTFWIDLWDSVVGKVMAVVDTVKAAWNELTAVFRGGDDGYAALGSLIGDGAAKWLLDTIDTIRIAWGELTDAFRGGDSGYGALESLIGEGAAERAVNAIGSVKTAWGELTSAFSGGDDGYGALSTIFGDVGAEYIVNAVATLGEALRGAGEWIAFAWEKATDLGGVLGGAIWETAKSLFSALVDVGRALFDAFREIGAAVWDLFQALSPVLLPVLKVVAGIIGVTLYVAIQGIIGALTLAARVVETLARVAAWLAENVLAPLIGVLGRVAAALIDRVAAALATVVEWVGKTISFVSDMGSKIIGAFSTAKTWLADAGRDIVQGLLDGIKTLAPKIGSFFLDLVPGWIREPFKKALGIASPSKVFAGYGQNIGEGLIGGLQSMQGRVEGALGGMVNTAVGVGDELREAFTGGDSGYAALGTVIGDDLARTAVNATAGAGQTVATAGIAASEATTAFQGGDDGYGAAASLLGDDAGKAAIDMSAQIGSAFTAAGDGINAVKAGMIDPAVAGLQQQMTDYATNTQSQMAGVLVPAMNAAGAGIATAKASLFDPAYAGMQAAVTTTAATTQSAMLGVALPAMQTAGSGIAAVQTGTVDPALAAMRGAVANTQSAFASGTAGILGEWNKVREGTAAPARFVISTVFNDGIVGMWNGVSDMIGTKKMAPHPVGFASGTSQILPGYTPGRDPFTFVEPNTGMSIGLSGGEGIARPEVVRALGSDRWDNLNAAAKMGGVSAVRKTLGQFAGGGVVPSIVGLVNRYFPGMSITSTYRNTNDHHGAGLAVDFSNGTDTTPQMQAAARFFHQNYAKGLLELIHWPLNGWQNIKNGAPLNYGEPTNSQHRNHVHVAAARPLPPPGGLVVPVPSGAGAAPIDWGAMVGEMLKPQADEIRGRIGGVRFPGLVGEMPDKTFESMLKPMQATIVKKMEETGGSMGDGGAGVERWRGLAMQALARHGYNPAQHIDAMMKQIQIESGGVPNAINNWDSNAVKGTPSGGLLQVIEPTYRRVRNAYPEAFVGLPDNHMIPATNLVAGVGAVRMDWGGPAGRWPTTGGYDQGGIANGMGFLQKKIVDPERVLNPRQTKAFEAWMAAGQRFDEINDLVASVQSMQLDSPEVMADEIGRRVAAWVGDDPADGSLRALAGALQSGVEWERVTAGMQRSAEAWANGDWVRVAEDKRLATPDEMRRQVEGNFLAELADEFGGLIGLKGLYKAPELVGDSGLVTLDKDTLAKLDAAVATPDGATPDVAVPTGVSGAADLANATRITTDTTTGGAGGPTDSGEKVIQVAMTVNVHGANDPMAISRQLTRDISRGLETAIGGQVRSQ